jgi:hypothetical protein
MNGETVFLHRFGVWSVPVCLLRIRGELAIGGIFVPQTSHEGRTVKAPSL